MRIGVARVMALRSQPGLQVEKLNTYGSFVESLVSHVSSALRSDCEAGSVSALKIRERLHALSARDGPGRKAVDARFALGHDDDKYLSMGVFPLWSAPETDISSPLVSSVLLPNETKEATAAGVISAWGNVLTDQKSKATEVLETVAVVVEWLLRIPEIREAVFDIVNEAKNGSTTQLEATYQTENYIQITNVFKTDKETFANILNALHIILDPGQYPMKSVDHLIKNSVTDTTTQAEESITRLFNTFLNTDGDWCEKGESVKRENFNNTSVCDPRPKSEYNVEEAQNLQALDVAMQRISASRASNGINTVMPNISPFVEYKSKEYWREDYLKKNVDGDRNPDIKYDDRSPDSAYIRYALVRGLCGDLGPHEEPMPEDELKYHYPNKKIGLSAINERMQRVLEHAFDLSSEQIKVLSTQSTKLFGPQFFLDVLGKTPDIAHTSLGRDPQNQMARNQEIARQARWSPTFKRDDKFVVLYDTPTSMAMCKAATMEHMITFLTAKMNEPSSDLKKKRQLRSSRAAAKMHQLAPMAYVAQNLWSRNNTSMSAMSAALNPQTPMPDEPQLETKPNEFLMTRPPIICTGDEGERLVFPVDIGLAVLESDQTELFVQSGVENDHGDSNRFSNGCTGDVYSNVQLTRNLQDMLYPDVGLFIGMPSWEQPYIPAGTRERRKAISTVDPKHLQLETLRGVVRAGMLSVKVLESVETKEKLMKQLNTEGTDERKRIFNISADLESNSRDRRAGLWDDALREVAISTDRLLVFIRTLSGMLGETAESILAGEDPELSASQKAIKDRRKDAVTRAMEFQKSLVETVVKTALKDSKLQLDINADKLGSTPNIVLTKTNAKEIIKDLASGESGRPFFNAQVELNNALESHAGPINMIDLLQQLSQIGNEYLKSLTSKIGTEPGSGVSSATLSLPRNSYMVRLKSDAYAAIRRAYQRLNNQIKHHAHYMRPISLWEYIEGKSMDLTTSFCELVSYELQHMRMSSTGLSAYVGQKQLTMNNIQRGISLNRIINTICEYSQQTPKPNFLDEDGRNQYFGCGGGEGYVSPSKQNVQTDGGSDEPDYKRLKVGSTQTSRITAIDDVEQRRPMHERKREHGLSGVMHYSSSSSNSERVMRDVALFSMAERLQEVGLWLAKEADDATSIGKEQEKALALKLKKDRKYSLERIWAERLKEVNLWLKKEAAAATSIGEDQERALALKIKDRKDTVFDLDGLKRIWADIISATFRRVTTLSKQSKGIWDELFQFIMFQYMSEISKEDTDSPPGLQMACSLVWKKYELAKKFCDQYGKTEFEGKKFQYNEGKSLTKLIEGKVLQENFPDKKKGFYVVEFVTNESDDDVSKMLNYVFTLDDDKKWIKAGGSDDFVWRRPIAESSIRRRAMVGIIQKILNTLDILMPYAKKTSKLFVMYIIFVSFLSFTGVGASESPKDIEDAGIVMKTFNGILNTNSVIVKTASDIPFYMKLILREALGIESPDACEDVSVFNVILGTAGSCQKQELNKQISKIPSMEQFATAFQVSKKILNTDNYQIYDEEIDTVYLADRL